MDSNFDAYRRGLRPASTGKDPRVLDGNRDRWDPWWSFPAIRDRTPSPHRRKRPHVPQRTDGPYGLSNGLLLSSGDPIGGLLGFEGGSKGDSSCRKGRFGTTRKRWLETHSFHETMAATCHAALAMAQHTRRRRCTRARCVGFDKAKGKKEVQLYDTTLRDGAQMVDVALTLEDKLKIAQRLFEFGVGYVEAGWPGSNPKDAAFFDAWNKLHRDGRVRPHMTKLAAFGSTRRKDVRCEDDPNIKSLLDCQAPVITMVAKAWSEQVIHVLNTSREENLNMIRDSVTYFKAYGKEVMLDAEHFFDGFKNDPEYAMECLKAAAEAGVDAVVLCETNGGCLPWDVEEITAMVVETLAPWEGVRIGIHTHNDTGMAIANSLAAVRSGATIVQGCINGIGERTGNADLITVAANLELKMGMSCMPEGRLSELTDLAHAVADVCHQPSPKSNPYIGSSAFAHKGGIHVAAVRKLPHSYNHIDPGLVGNAMRSVVSELSGRGNILDKVESAGLQLDKEGVGSVLAMIKQLENEGFAFENAGASVDMILIRRGSSYAAPFKVLEYTVMSGNRLEEESSSREGCTARASTNQAMVKLEIDGNTFMSAGEGNGPVDALAAALRTGLCSRFPQIETVHLKDYNVHLLDTRGSQSTTRVTIEFSNPACSKWSTVGAHTSIVDASFRALLDGLEFGVLNCTTDGCNFNGQLNSNILSTRSTSGVPP